MEWKVKAKKNGRMIWVGTSNGIPSKFDTGKTLLLHC